jgi:hypothetical protein
VLRGVLLVGDVWLGVLICGARRWFSVSAIRRHGRSRMVGHSHKPLGLLGRVARPRLHHLGGGCCPWIHFVCHWLRSLLPRTVWLCLCQRPPTRRSAEPRRLRWQLTGPRDVRSRLDLGLIQRGGGGWPSISRGLGPLLAMGRAWSFSYGVRCCGCRPSCGRFSRQASREFTKTGLGRFLQFCRCRPLVRVLTEHAGNG